MRAVRRRCAEHAQDPMTRHTTTFCAGSRRFKMPLRRHKKNPPGEPLFTPCTLYDSLLEAITEAAENATAGDVISYLLACLSFDRFQNHQQRAERSCRRSKSISGGGPRANPHMNGRTSGTLNDDRYSPGTQAFSPRGFLRENRGANHSITYLSERTQLRQIL
jgi:hypothetical protein